MSYDLETLLILLFFATCVSFVAMRGGYLAAKEETKEIIETYKDREWLYNAEILVSEEVEKALVKELQELKDYYSCKHGVPFKTTNVCIECLDDNKEQ